MSPDELDLIGGAGEQIAIANLQIVQNFLQGSDLGFFRFAKGHPINSEEHTLIPARIDLIKPEVVELEAGNSKKAFVFEVAVTSLVVAKVIALCESGKLFVQGLYPNRTYAISSASLAREALLNIFDAPEVPLGDS